MVKSTLTQNQTNMEEVQKARGCNKRESEEEDNLLTAVFTAGIVLLIVCLKRALLLFLLEQWRAWIFLVLNILLLAIFFTSTSSSTAATADQNLRHEAKVDVKTKISDQCGEDTSCRESKAEEAESVEADGEQCKLSKEELNERVEAFIAMFRQHLASDARKGRRSCFSKVKMSDDQLKFGGGRGSCVSRSPLMDLSVSC